MAKAREMKENASFIELRDKKKYKISMDFNTFDALEEIYGDIGTAMEVFSSGSPKMKDVRNFLTAMINGCIEDTAEHLSSFEVGKLLDFNKVDVYVDSIMELLDNAMPEKEEDEDNEENEKN